MGNSYLAYFLHVKNHFMHIVQIIQKNLGFSSLEKIDLNTQQVPGNEHLLGNNALAQAAIPAILLGIFNRLEQNPDPEPLTAIPSSGLLFWIFGKSTEAVTEQIAVYSKIRDKHIFCRNWSILLLNQHEL